MRNGNQLSLEKSLLLAAWIEAIFYGFLLCMYGATLYLYFSPEYRRVGGKLARHTKVMILFSCTMFAVATLHLSLNAYRLVHAFSDRRLSPGGAAEYLDELKRWDQIFRYALFATQINLGGAAAIYRCWMQWNYNWKICIFPTILLVISTVFGYIVCGTYHSVNPTATIFSGGPLLDRIITFYSLSVGLNMMTTCLISYRTWKTREGLSSNHPLSKSVPQLSRIFVESFALQLVFEAVLLALYSANINAQYVFLESITPVIGIAFNALTVQMKLNPPSSTTSELTIGVRAVPVAHTAPPARIRTVGNTALDSSGKRLRVFSVIEEVDEDINSFKNASNPDIGHAL